MARTVLITTSSFGTYDQEPVEMIKSAGLVPVLNPHGRKLAPEETKSIFQANSPVGIVAGTEKLSRELLESAADLKVISRVGTGWDNVDHTTAKKCGILVYRTPDSHVDAVTELAIGLMLSVLRNIARADRNVREGKWKPIMGQLLHHKVVGLVGYGLVGKRMASVLSNGFGATVIAYDPYIADKEWGDAGGVKLRSLEDLLKISDIVSLHVPGGDGYLIGAREFGLMKRGAVIINTARGGLIDEAALKEAIDKGMLEGAGLDVFETEPYQGPLRLSDKVVMTMHMGSYAKESRIRMEVEAVENLLTGLREKGVIK